MSRSITFVTGNANKLKEVKAILSQGGSPIDVISQSVEVPEIQGTTQEVAKYKASAAAEIIGGPCITEDTALCFSALGGLPGPYIKTFLDTLGHAGLNAMLSGFDDKRATALCTFAFCAGPDREPELFEGRCGGSIVTARGPKNFGWDPIFEVEGRGKTFAEMAAEEKNEISHRSRALAKLREFLQARA